MKRYCFRECISISHSTDGSRKNAHVHTVEVATFMQTDEKQNDIKRFADLEAVIGNCLKPYNGCFLNEMNGFGENAGIEYLGEVLFARMEKVLEENGMFLERFEISENPLRTYILTRKR